MNYKLRPCPRCAGPTNVQWNEDIFSVCCSDDDCFGADVFVVIYEGEDPADTETRAVAMWNKRPIEDALLEAAKEGRTDLMICADNVRDAAKTDPRWEGVAEKLMARVAMMDAVISKAEAKL